MKPLLWVIVVFGSASAWAQQPAAYEGAPETLPRVLDPQPVAFDHKLHMGFDMQCLQCHPGAVAKDRAGLPQSDLCLTCHAAVAVDDPEVAKLAGFAERGERIRWVRAYDVPEFVYFSHKEHAEAAECAQCHGPVAEREVMAQEVSTSMTACMNCHAEHGAPRECHLCHELGQ